MTKRTLLIAATGAPLKVQGKYRGMWPAPVYVAEFADGTIGRHSFYSQAGKLEFERGRTGACWLWRNDWPASTVPRSDIIAGHIEHDGHVFADPHFDHTVVPIKSKADPVALLIAKIRKLDWSEIERVQAAIDQRLAA